MNEIDILLYGILLLSCRLNVQAVTNRSYFFNNGDNATLECDEKSLNIWQGPPNFTTYTSGDEVNNQLIHKDRLSIMRKKAPPQFNLRIERFGKKDEGLYKCIQYAESIKTDIFFNVHFKNIPDVSIKPDSNITAQEGSSVELECNYISNYPVKKILWTKISPDASTLSINESKLSFEHINRSQSGTYECLVENTRNNGKDYVSIVVQTIDIKYNETDTKRIFQCIPVGLPSRYTYFDWEHRTECGDIIRTLTDDGHGKLMLTKDKTNAKWVFERGVYVCSVSNGIDIEDRPTFKKAYFLNETGKPHFISSNVKEMYAAVGSKAEIMVDFISFPKVSYITLLNSTSNRKNDYQHSIIDNVKIYETISGKNIALLGSRLTIEFALKSIHDFQQYTITLSNLLGNSSYTINILPQISTKKSANDAIYSLIPIAILSVVLAVMGYRIYYRGTPKKFEILRNFCLKRNSVQNEVVGGAVENEVYDIQDNVAQAAGTRPNDIPVYSSIERRDNISVDQQAQSVQYCASKKKKPDPCAQRQIITSTNLAERTSAINYTDNSQLNYIDVCFDPSPGETRYKIHGIDKKNPYAEIDFARTADVMQMSFIPDNSDDEDFADAEDVRKMKRKTFLQ